MRFFRGGWTTRRWLALGVVTLGAACAGSSDDAAPEAKPKTGTVEEIALEVPPACDDIGAENGWEDALCESGGNKACGGQGVATFDCDHCCEAPPLPSCGAVAKASGWAGYACESVDDDACFGLGVPSSDCEVCCEAPSAPPTCAAVASEWGFDKAVCETGDNGACGGEGPATSDCDHCCDVDEAEDADLADDPDGALPPEDDSDDDPSDEEFAADFPDTEGVDPGPDDDSVPPKPPPPPSQYCGVVASNNGWPNAVCEYGGNGACKGQGPATVDCDHCCSGTGTTPPASGCGNGTCEASESCVSCAKDCGACLRVAELNVDGVSSKQQLYKAAKALRAQKPAVVGLQGATKAQVKFVSKRVKAKQSRFVATGKEGSQKVGLGLLSDYSIKHLKVRRLPGKEALAVGGVRTPLGEFPFGVTWLRDDKAKAAASQAALRLKDGHAMLAANLGGEQGSAAFKVIDAKLPDGWSSAWGPGKTTDDARRDFLFHGKSWEAPAAGKVVGPHSDKLHGSVVEKYRLTRMGSTCDKPSTLAQLADLADVHLGTLLGAGVISQHPETAAMIADQFDTITIEEHLAYVSRSVVGPDGKPTCERDPGWYFDRVDPPYDYARAHNRRTRYHPLLWDPSEYKAGKDPTFIVPRWQICMADDPAARGKMLDVVKDYIAKVMQHVQERGGADEWIVVNEAINNSNGAPHRNIFRSTIPDTPGHKYRYIAEAFRAARKADGKATLIYNDYGCEFYDQEAAEKKGELSDDDKKRKQSNTKANGVYQLVKSLAHQGVPIDAVGFQMHYRVDRDGTSGAPSWDFDADKFRASLRRYAKIKHKGKARRGVDVYITEFDLQASVQQAGFPDPPEARLTDEMRKNIFAKIIGVCSTEPNCKGVAFWGATDREKWVIKAFGGEQDPPPGPTQNTQLFNASSAPNPQTFCSAARGLMQGACGSCAAWRQGPQPPLPCGDTLYQCQ